MYLLNAYREYIIWKRVRSVANEYTDQLGSEGFRVDWIGRIYTVINLPEEVITAAPQIQEGYVLMKLRDYDKLFLKLGIADYIVPEMERIEGEDSAAFLLILSPDRDYIRVWPFIKFLLRMGILAIVLRIVYVIGERNLDVITHLWTSLTNLLL